MDGSVFKSVLPAQGSVSLDDTALALPQEDDETSRAEKTHSDERILRVQRQVRLTLARRGRKTASHDAVRSRRSPARSPDPKVGPSPNFKVNGLSFSHQSLSPGPELRPSRRVEVSPLPSPKAPRRSHDHGTLRFGTYPLCDLSQSLRMCSLPDRSFGFRSLWRYAPSEMPLGARFHTSSRGDGSRFGSGGPTAAPQALATDGSFQRRTLVDSIRSHRRTDIPTESGSTRRDGQNSHTSSAAGTEVDRPKTREVEPVRTKDVTPRRPENKPPELTLERAVSLLTRDDEDTLVTAAGFIQTHCLNSEDAKKMVFYLHGITKLLHLVRSDSEEVQIVAAGALRNLVFQSDDNKMEVKENQGLTTILRILKTNRSVETRRQLTGLLWNLSSHDLLKEHLSREALPVLTDNVLVPCSGIFEGENPKDDLLADPDTFHNATGCLRNVSSAGPDSRKAMRECENLIDSLVYYIRGAIADYKPDDKATENCVCILHNLSFQMEAELPQKRLVDLCESGQDPASGPKTPGCFALRSAKTPETERRCPLLEEKANPRGVEWLWSTITVRMYLSLIARSVRHYSREAAMGALQNITAGNGPITEAIAHTVVRREHGLRQLTKMLRKEEREMKHMAVSLVKNLSRYRELHPEIVKQVLPEVVRMLPDSDTGAELPAEVTTSLCHILMNLSRNGTQNVKAIVNHGALTKIIDVSTEDDGYGPTRAGQAASILLHSMWNHGELHGAYRKAGYKKSDFVNGRTTKAVNSSPE